MKNYEVKCHYCGEVFQSQRKDTKYCSDSCRVMASRERKKENMPDETSVSVKFTPDEYKILSKTAKSAGISVEDTVKYRSLASMATIETKEDEIAELKKEVIRLKAHLSIFTKEPSAGIFLPADEDSVDFIRTMVEDNWKPLLDKQNPDSDNTEPLEEYMIYLLKNCKSV